MTTMTATRKTQTKRLSRRAALRATALLHNEQGVQAGRLAPKLRAFFRAQAKAAVAAMVGANAYPTKAAGLDDIVPAGDGAKLATVARPYTLQTIVASAEIASNLVGLTSGLVDQDPHTQALLARSSTRVVAINESTRRAVQQTLVDGTARGLSPYEIAHGVREVRDGRRIVRRAFRGIGSVVEETYKGRADTIARTEMAVASQQASVDRYRAAGVTSVDVIDGSECGWLSHEDSDMADGTTRTMNEAEDQPIAHPNCRRVFMPVVEQVAKPTEQQAVDTGPYTDNADSMADGIAWRDAQNTVKPTNAQLQALDDYSGAGFRPINSILRNEGRYNSTSKLVRQTKHLDDVIQAGELSENTVLYRGLSDDALERMLNSGKGVGQIYKEKAFASTSAHAQGSFWTEMGGEFGGSRIGMRIHAPRGTKAGFPTGASNAHEAEVLLARNSRFRITKIAEGPRGRGKIVDVELLPPS